MVNGLYATFERAFGRLTVSPGVRLEATTISVDQINVGARSSQKYSGVYPTLQLTYNLGSSEQLKFSYGRRIERPDVSALDPFRLEISQVAFFSGNPALKPALTNSLEAGYEYHLMDTNYQANLYYRESTGLFFVLLKDIGGGVLLDTLENVGKSRNTGVELVANRSLTKTISINASGSLSSSMLDASNLGILGTRSAVLLSGRVSLNWKPSPLDFIQLGNQVSGRTLTAQGYRKNDVTLNLGWRHSFTKALSTVITVQDPFDSYRVKTAVNTATLVSRETEAIRARALFVGLTYAFGGAGGPPSKISTSDSRQVRVQANPARDLVPC